MLSLTRASAASAAEKACFIGDGSSAAADAAETTEAVERRVYSGADCIARGTPTGSAAKEKKEYANMPRESLPSAQGTYSARH